MISIIYLWRICKKKEKKERRKIPFKALYVNRFHASVPSGVSKVEAPPYIILT